jgi:tRNA splicing endonuclease
MLIGLQSQVKHLTRLIALLVHEFVADSQEAREAGLNNLVEVLSVIAVGGLVAEGTADGKQTLQASEDGARVIRVQKLEGEIHELWPAGWEVILKDSLEDGNELLADEAFGSSKNRQKAVSYTSLLIFRDCGGGGFGRVPLAIP